MTDTTEKTASPTPWEERPERTSVPGVTAGIYEIGIYEKGHGHVAIINCNGPNPVWNKRQREYARLITAAPELAEALEKLLVIVLEAGLLYMAPETIKNVRTVLAKARPGGGQP